MYLRIESGYADIFGKALTHPNKRYITFLHDHYDTTSHSGRRAKLHTLFKHAQEHLIESTFSEDLDKKSLLDLVENTRLLKERYEKRAGNILVRLKFYTPKQKKETLASADALIEQATALHAFRGCIENPNIQPEALKESLAVLTGDDPAFIVKLLEKAKPGEPLHHIEPLLNELLQQHFESLMQSAFTHFDMFEKGLYTFKNGLWTAKAHPHATPNTSWANLHQLAVNALHYLPYIDYESPLFLEHRDTLNLIMKRGLGISSANGRYWRDPNATEMLKFEDRIQFTTGRTLKEEMIPRIIKDGGAVTTSFQELLDKVMPLEEFFIDNRGSPLVENLDTINSFMKAYREGNANFRNAFRNMSPRFEYFMKLCHEADKETIRAVPENLRVYYLANLLKEKKHIPEYVFVRYTCAIERNRYHDVSTLSIKAQKNLLELFYHIGDSVELFELYAPSTFRILQQLNNEKPDAESPFSVKVAQAIKGKRGYEQLIDPLFVLYDWQRQFSQNALWYWPNYLELPLELKKFCGEHLPQVTTAFATMKGARVPLEFNLSLYLERMESVLTALFHYEPVNEEEWKAVESEEAYELYLRHLHQVTAELENYAETLNTIESACKSEVAEVAHQFKPGREFVEKMYLKLQDFARSKTIEELRASPT